MATTKSDSGDTPKAAQNTAPSQTNAAPTDIGIPLEDPPTGVQADAQRTDYAFRKADDEHVVETDASSLQKGYWGTRPAGPEDKEYSLETGPTSPGEYDNQEA